jgi:hypothetical protein
VGKETAEEAEGAEMSEGFIGFEFVSFGGRIDNNERDVRSV